MASTILDKQALLKWEEYRKALISSSSVPTETYEQRRSRIARLEADPELWFKYYFEKYCTAEPAKFHKESTKRIMANPTWYECRAWSREMAKDARTMMEVLYLALTGKKKCICLFSWSDGNACNLLMPYMINLESNPRIIADYGKQKGLRNWEIGQFVTINGVAFYGFGAGRNPQGTRNEEVRPDVMIFSDLDTDEVCRNPVRLNEIWKWVNGVVIPMVSVSKDKLILWLNNITAKDCCMIRAMQIANHSEIINIRDKNGKSQWPEKNSEENIDTLLSFVDYIGAQKAYFNNPITEGTIFKEMKWDAVPPLSKFRFLVAYGDPAPSNSENKNSSFKSTFLVGRIEDTYYVITGFLDHCKNTTFVQWFYDIEDYVAGKAMIYNVIENNKLQDPFYEQVYVPLFQQAGKLKGKYIITIPDTRKKPDKFVRIEGSLEPLNRTGKLILNIKEKNNPHMQRLEEQFKCVEPTLSAPVDGPDCIEGGKYIIDSKIVSMVPPITGVRDHSLNKKRF